MGLHRSGGLKRPCYLQPALQGLCPQSAFRMHAIRLNTEGRQFIFIPRRKAEGWDALDLRKGRYAVHPGHERPLPVWRNAAYASRFAILRPPLLPEAPMNEPPPTPEDQPKESPKILGEGQEKAVIEYPTAWAFTLFGREEQDVRAALATVMGMREYSFAFSHTSKGGKYLSFKMETVVGDEAERLSLCQQLAEREEILFVL